MQQIKKLILAKLENIHECKFKFRRNPGIISPGLRLRLNYYYDFFQA